MLRGMLRSAFVVSMLLALPAWLGCHTIGTAADRAGKAAGDTARAAGEAAGTAAEGAGNVVHDTSEAAEDELD